MPPHEIARSRLVTAAALAAAAAALTALLLVPPIVGMADNGDFDRVMSPAGLAPVSADRDDRFFRWMQPRFAYAPRTADLSAFRTSESLLVELAVAVSRHLSTEAYFDIRLLGALHAALLLCALGFLVSACGGLSAPAQALAAALLVFFFTDPGYVAPFQSLYSQTASFLFLLLTAGIAARGVRRGRLEGPALAGYFLFAALFVCSKPQECVQAILLAPFGVRLAWPGSRRGRAAAILFAAALSGIAWRYYRSAEASNGWIARYNMLFVELLPDSPDPKADLAELGLDPALARFAGVSAWVPESPARLPGVRAFLDRGRPSPRMLYLRHPERLAAILSRAAKSSFALQPRDLGHFAKESGAPAFARAWGAWSALRLRLSGLPVLIGLFGGTLAAVAATYRRASSRGRLFREGLAVLVAMAAGAFVVAALGDWHLELQRHLYSFQAMCDLILVADAVWVVQATASGRLGTSPPGN